MLNLPVNVPIENPNGTWSFVGRVSMALTVQTEDGGWPSNEVCEEIARSNFPAMVMKHHGVSTRVYPSKEAAIAFAEKHGFTVTDNS